MTWYSQLPAHRTRQVLGDALLLGWVLAWALIARMVHGLIAALAGPAEALVGSGNAVNDRLAGASRELSDVAIIGDRLSDIFGKLAAPGDTLSSAGQQAAEGLHTLANAVGLVLFFAPVLAVGVPYVVMRRRFAQRSAAVRGLLAADCDPSFFAFRALATLPVERIARISSDPWGDLQRGDAATISALARLDAADAGIDLGKRSPATNEQRTSRQRAGQQRPARSRDRQTAQDTPSTGRPSSR